MPDSRPSKPCQPPCSTTQGLLHSTSHTLFHSRGQRTSIALRILQTHDTDADTDADADADANADADADTDTDTDTDNDNDNTNSNAISLNSAFYEINRNSKRFIKNNADSKS